MRRVKQIAQRLLPRPLVERLRVAYGRRTRFKDARRRVMESAGKRHLVYALTPPPSLANVGDQAQAVAIRAWLGKYFPGHEILEVDKNEVLHCVAELRATTTPETPVFLHSGGNLGDRGIWSETGRRMVIRALPRSIVISLPQTIYFSDTPEGRRQQAISQRVYGGHPNLTVIGRDTRSGELAAELFPGATTFAAPDFVLSATPQRDDARYGGNADRVLLCLRNDTESALDGPTRERLASLLPAGVQRYDTTMQSRIDRADREAILRDTLGYFASFRAVVTDRYHGLIFAVLGQRPTVVLGTVDHKLSSAFDWFESIRGVRFAPSVDDTPTLLEEVLNEGFSGAPDWNGVYFDPLGERCVEAVREHTAGLGA